MPKRFIFKEKEDYYYSGRRILPNRQIKIDCYGQVTTAQLYIKCTFISSLIHINIVLYLIPPLLYMRSYCTLNTFTPIVHCVYLKLYTARLAVAVDTVGHNGHLTEQGQLEHQQL